MISLLVSLCFAVNSVSPVSAYDVFALQGENNIMDEEHFGIINGLATMGVNYKDVAALSGFWAPPFVSSDFLLEVKLFGENVSTKQYVWRPFEVIREGVIHDIRVNTVSLLPYGRRAGILTVILENLGNTDLNIPLEITLRGTLDKAVVWEFSRTLSQTPAPAAMLEHGLVKTQNDCVLVLQTNATVIAWNADTSSGAGTFSLHAGKLETLHLIMSMGEATASTAVQTLLTNPEQQIELSRAEYNRRVEDIFTKLPRLSSDNPALESFYNRSLVHLITNRWEVPEFVLHPYYGTGCIKGGCVCNYLWNFGEVWEILPLYDPQAAREHIKQFLKTDITRHFAFLPITGEAFGPWYMVNQEKIIGLIYYYVKNTGDTAFLHERVGGKSVLDWVIQNAMHGDDPSKPVQLIDYGASNSHLELRRGFPYNHVMPDLNGRRYMNYQMAAELCALMGKPEPYLKERAEALKSLLKSELWDPKAKWFRFKDENGTPDLRYTVQMFKLFNSPVLDEEETLGLLSHLNETEFLSEFGLHSMAKNDIAYDQVDIDNGGGGACTCFPPQIADRLYKSGHAREADGILKRILWWGTRMPYWGDSLVANSMDYRKDTPLQCTVDGVTVAQCIIFGLFGVEAAFNGDITIHPHYAALAEQIKLSGLHLRGQTFDIEIKADAYDVWCGEQHLHATMPKTVLFSVQDKTLKIMD